MILIGENRGEIGGSEYLKTLHGLIRGVPPRVDLARERAVQSLLPGARAGAALISSAQDVSDGGLAVALAECTFDTGGIGVDVGSRRPRTASVRASPDVDATLFGESAPLVVVACEAATADDVLARAAAAGTPGAAHRTHRRLGNPHRHRRPRGARRRRRRGRAGVGDGDCARMAAAARSRRGVASVTPITHGQISTTSAASSASSATPKRPTSPTSASTRCNTADRRAPASRPPTASASSSSRGDGRRSPTSSTRPIARRAHRRHRHRPRALLDRRVEPHRERAAAAHRLRARPVRHRPQRQPGQRRPS